MLTLCLLFRVERVFARSDRVHCRRNLSFDFVLLLRIHAWLARLISWTDNLNICFHRNLEFCLLYWLGLLTLLRLLICLCQRTMESKRQVRLMSCFLCLVRYLCKGRLFLKRKVLAVSSTRVVSVIKRLHILTSVCNCLHWLHWRLNCRSGFERSCLTGLATCNTTGWFLNNTDLLWSLL